MRLWSAIGAGTVLVIAIPVLLSTGNIGGVMTATCTLRHPPHVRAFNAISSHPDSIVVVSGHTRRSSSVSSDVVAQTPALWAWRAAICGRIRCPAAIMTRATLPFLLLTATSLISVALSAVAIAAAVLTVPASTTVRLTVAVYAGPAATQTVLIPVAGGRMRSSARCCCGRTSSSIIITVARSAARLKVPPLATCHVGIASALLLPVPHTVTIR
jgi:hypothetical protein